MNGHILPGTTIAVDFWKTQGRQENFVHFLTHLHGDHIVGLTSTWQRPIYCSAITAELLATPQYGISRSCLHVCPINQSIIVHVSSSQTITVTAYDANHCPGAVMFYFQGDFGNILYTGDFRASLSIIEACRPLVNKIDFLYLDNTYCSPNCDFPSREECTSKIVNIIREHPGHDIVIGVRKLGKESLLANLGETLDETISVSPEFYNVTQMLFHTNVFTTAARREGQCRISTVPQTRITRKYVEHLNKTRPTIVIIPSAIYTGLNCEPFCRDQNIHIVPYSDHSSYPELVEFVSTLAPRKIIPIVSSTRGPFGIDISDRADMSCFQPLLSANFPSSSQESSFSASQEDSMLLINHSLEKQELNTFSAQEISGIPSFSCSLAPAKNTAFWLSSVCSSSHGSVPHNNHRKIKRKKSFPLHHMKAKAKGVIYDDSEWDENELKKVCRYPQANVVMTSEKGHAFGEAENYLSKARENEIDGTLEDNCLDNDLKDDCYNIELVDSPPEQRQKANKARSCLAYEKKQNHDNHDTKWLHVHHCSCKDGSELQTLSKSNNFSYDHDQDDILDLTTEEFESTKDTDSHSSCNKNDTDHNCSKSITDDDDDLLNMSTSYESGDEVHSQPSCERQKLRPNHNKSNSLDEHDIIDLTEEDFQEVDNSISVGDSDISDTAAQESKTGSTDNTLFSKLHNVCSGMRKYHWPGLVKAKSFHEDNGHGFSYFPRYENSPHHQKCQPHERGRNQNITVISDRDFIMSVQKFLKILS